VVAGIGVNLSWAPPGAARLEVDREALLDLLLNGLDRWFATPPEGVLERWRALSSTLGRRVRAELPGGVVEGIATDVDPDGALLVDGARIAAGDVIHLRPVRPGAGAARRTGP
jgi:BirA family biotin operon repressor/biotin-[acetyl-CoA-carboxylase] ligase